MLCQQCKERDAVLNLTHLVGDAVQQVHLCEKCAAERGLPTTIAMPKVFDERLQALTATSFGIGVLVAAVYTLAAFSHCIGAEDRSVALMRAEVT